MSVLFVEGFETSADQTDVNKKGLLTCTTAAQSGAGVIPIPSRTGVAGIGLFLRGPYGGNTGQPCNAATVSDFGLISLNQSVYSLWQAGGFAVGVNASFNSLNTFQVAPGDVGQLVYDGATNYWAICYTGSAYVVAYSTDLKNWTQTTAQPATINITSSICVTGSGSSATILVNNTASSSTGTNTYYSTNMGGTWATMNQVNANWGTVIPTTNANAPFVGLAWVNTVGYKLYFYTSVSGSQTLVASSPVIVVAPSNFIYAIGKQSNGLIMLAGSKTAAGGNFPVTGNVSQVTTCLASNNPSLVGNWIQLAASPQMLNDLIYFNGYVIGVGYGGLWYNSNTAASAWTLGTGFASGSTNVVSAIATNGSIAVAVGTDPTVAGSGAIWTSTNGTTWTKANRFIFNGAAATSSAVLTSVTWDGTRFIATGGLNSNVVATSTDGISWYVISATDYAEAATGLTSMAFLGVFSGTQSPSTGIFTPWGTAAGNTSGAGFTCSTSSGGTRTVTAAAVTANALVNGSSLSVSAVAAALGAQPPATLSHYYELVFTAVAGTPNLFNVVALIDGVSVGTLVGQLQMAATTDTTGVSQAFLNLPRSGCFTQVDDIYLTNFSGAYHNGRLGTQRIYPIVASSDVSDQLTTSNNGATNSNTVNAELSNAEGYVYSTATTAQDIYGTTNAVPSSGVSINAVQMEGFLATYNGSSPSTGQIGVQSNGKQSLGVSLTTSGAPTRAVALVELDPNTNAPWTNSGLNAVDIVVAKTS
jgi:hypothetical protein